MIFDTYVCKTKEVNIRPNEKSYEVPGCDGARTSKLVPYGKLACYRYPEATTYIEMLERGCTVSDNGPCMRWIISPTEYSCINYKDVLSRSIHFGSGLIKLGLQLSQENYICIYAQNSVEWIIAETGSFYYSSPVVPLYDTIGPDARTFMIRNVETKVVICDAENKVKALLEKSYETPTLEHIVHIKEISDDIKELGKQKGICLHLFKEVEELGKTYAAPTKLPCPEDTAIICFTSGTTGNPKGAVITHKNMLASTSGSYDGLGDLIPTKADVSISYLPLGHVFEQLMVVLMFLNGGSVGFFRGNVSKLTDDMKILQPTIFAAVPRVLNKIYEKIQESAKMLKRNTMVNESVPKETKNSENGDTASYDPRICKSVIDSLGSKVRLIICGSAPIPITVLGFYRKALNIQVVEAYGQTENSGPCAINIVDDIIESVGPPLPSCMIKLVDVPELDYFKKDSAGEVCVKGPIICKGYYKNREKTAEVFDEEGWLHTGDIGMWLPDGTLKIVDRKKDIFKLAQGEYIMPEKIETIYLECPFVSQIFVHGESVQNFLVAIIVPNEIRLSAWCKESGIRGTWNEICENEVVKQHILGDLQRIGKSAGLLSFQQVKTIHLHPQLLTIEEGHLTPTQKLRRNVVRKVFKDKINEMYCQNTGA